MEREGIIKYQLQHSHGLLPACALCEIDKLSFWQKKLKFLEMIGGNDPQRYQGLGFGNLSARTSNNYEDAQAHSFVITGSQTGHLSHLAIDHFAWVSHFSIADNELISSGPMIPSSESLTHAVIYATCSAVRYIFHVHSPLIWNHYDVLQIPLTDPKYSYGTQGIAWAIREKIEEHSLKYFGLLAMGGHRDGVIIFGNSASLIGEQLCILHHRASCLTEGVT